MYAKFFGLRELPFNNTPDPRFFYATTDHEEALASLLYAVQERKGFVLLTGEVGVGKTLVSRMMLRQFGTRITFANIHHAVQGAADLVESLCTEFELPVETDASHSKRVRALHDFLLAQFGKDNPVVLVLDEAQALPAEAFEQLRMIGNLEADDAKLLQTVILGQPELQRRFALPEFRQLRQRIFRVFHLPALSRKVTEEYIRHRLAVAGGPDLDVFDDAAIDMVYEYSQGLPRLINTICDNAMLSAYSADRRRIDRPFVESIIEQLMSLGEEEEEAVVGVGGPVTGTAHPPPPGGTLPLPGVAEQGRPPDSAVSQQVIVALATRIAELETRLRRTQDVLPPRVATTGGAVDSNSINRVQAKVDRIERELLSKVDKAGRCLADLDRKTARTAALLAQARKIGAVIEPVVRDARAAAARLDSGRRAVSQQEAHVHRAAMSVKAAVEETRLMFDGLKRASAKTHRIERSAQKTHDRLVVQTERSRELARELAIRAERAAASNRRNSARPSSSAPKSTPGDRDRTVDLPVAVGPDRLRQILNESRERLSDLRILVRRTGDRRVTDPNSLHSRIASGMDPHSVAPTARLTHQVESLLDIVESGQVTR